MLTGSEYFGELKGGARIKGGEVSTGDYYSQIAVGTNGSAVGVPVFSAWTSRSTVNVNGTLGVSGTTTGLVSNNTTAPTSGTITGFFTSAAGTTAGSVVLWGTTAGTIATITYGTTVGLITGTNVLLASVKAGDTVIVTSSTAGTCTAFISFQTNQ